MDCKKPNAADGLSGSCQLHSFIMCLVDRPVEVQIKDGGIFSGIFFTANVRGGYDVVLKKAKMIKRGKNDIPGVVEGAVIDTLMIGSSDLVQVIAKGVPIQADGAGGSSADDGLVASVDCTQNLYRVQGEPTKPSQLQAIEVSENGQSKSWGTSKDNISLNNSATTMYQVGPPLEDDEGLDSREAEVSNAKQDSILVEEGGWEDSSSTRNRKVACQVASSISPRHIPLVDKKVVDERPAEPSSTFSNIESGASCVHEINPPEGPCSKSFNSRSCPASSPLTPNTPCSPTSSVYISSSSCSNKLTPATSLRNSNIKEFKLNPSAKTFSPSISNSRSAPTTASSVGNMSYVSNSFFGGTTSALQTGIEASSFAPGVSVPVKFVQYSNGIPGSSSQYTFPVMGQIGGRQQAVRYGAQYPVLPAYPPPSHPSSQTVMLGRVGQVVYVHPVSPDVVPAATTFTQGPACHVLTTPHQPPLQKHQGAASPALQLCMTPSLLGAGQQPFGLPTQNPFPQPVPAMRSIPVVPSVTSMLGGVPVIL